MKKITSLLLTVVMIATLFTAVPISAETSTGFAGGTGTKDDPFLISNVAELNYLNEVVNTGATYEDEEGSTKNYYQAAYKLTADIDYGNAEWTPLGQALALSYDTATSSIVKTPTFQGTFDGGNHVIKNVKMTSDSSATTPTSQYVGFFGRAYSATIKNLGLDNIDIQWANHDYKYDVANNKTERVQHYGVFIGAMAITNISNCYVINSTVKNTNRGTNDNGVGGFVGAMDFTNTINNCYVYNTEIQASQVKHQAGFAGNCLSNSNVITNSYAAEIKIDDSSVISTTYGFEFNGRSDTTTNTATNCWSTLGDAQGLYCATYGHANAYKPAQSLGVSGATPEALIEAMLATGAYAVDNNINGGYPYLKSGFDGTPAETYAGGSGTEDDPYLISTPAELLLASRQVNAGVATANYFKLLNDIDYEYQPWEPIGYSSDSGNRDFRGGFDGNNHVIKNLTLADGEIYYCGIFGLLTGATIKNLGVENFQLIKSNVKGNYIRVIGGFAGAARSTNEGVATTITNCYVKDSSVQQKRAFSNQSNGEYTDMNLGGFIGLVDIRYAPTEIKNCYIDNISLYNAVQGRACGFIGGVTEYGNTVATAVKLTNCYAANITNAKGTGTTQIGFGYTGGSSNTFNANKIIIENCYSTFTSVKGTESYASTAADNPNLRFGTEGADKATIAAAFRNLDGWQDGSAINDGYPALAWETLEEAPAYLIKTVNKEIANLNITGTSGSYASSPSTDGKVTVEVQRRPDVTDTATLYVAGYDMDGRMTGAQKATVNKNDFTFTADINGKEALTVKVFLWDDEQDALVKPYQAETTIFTPLDVVWSPVSNSGSGEQPTRKTRLVLMGDSIMDSVWNTTNYSWNKYGWEAYIGQYLTDDMTVIKHGHSGQTVKDFINGRSTYHVCSWDTIKTQFGAGDYVVLALGSNDHNSIVAGDFTVDDYKNWYRQIIRETRAKGATIILSTPKVAASTYNSATGKFDPEAQAPKARKAAIEVANEMGVEYVDMTVAYADALNTMLENKEYTYEEMAIQKSGSTVTGPGLIYVDGTHLTEFGAQLFARLFAEQIESKTTGLEEFVVIQ